jgi:aminoglycoside phosphotransferase (APT) family kinase protein
MRVYVEIGEKKVFAVAIDWLGLARVAKTEGEALAAVVAYVPRYMEAVGEVAAQLNAPATAAGLEIVDRLPGNKTTDFGAPAAIIDSDRARLSDPELDAALLQLRAAWNAFAASAARARGRELGPSGPRGGGRDLERMMEHVREADEGYSGAVGMASKPAGAPWEKVHENFITAVRARNAGELPDVGPRGGDRWPGLFAMRRSAWHSLDHAWELDDRSS